MREPHVGRLLRRAVLRALVVPPIVGCGASAGAANAGDATVDAASAPVKDPASTEASVSVSDSDSAPVSDAAVPAPEAGLPTCALPSTVPMWTADRGCVDYFALDGTFQSCGADDAGTLPPSQCAALCPVEQGDAPALACAIDPPYMGSPALVACEYFNCGVGTGRRPEGLVPCESAWGPTATARTLAGMAHLEAASVHAFLHLACELEAHGAPDTLSRAARRAASDEVRHARDVTALAESEGGRVPEVRTTEPRIRTLEGMATENAVEGCVRETFGAAVAAMQAERAGDRRWRHAMRRIARDEVRHAELAWAVARWIEPRLDEGGRRRVHEARTHAVETLAREVAREPEASSMARLGMPSASQARAVVDELTGSLWS